MSLDSDAQPAPSSPSLEQDITTFWRASENGTDVQCVLSWDGRRYRLRLVRGEQVVKDERAPDDAPLVALAQWWRREYDAGGTGAVESFDARKLVAQRPCPNCGSGRTRLVGQSGDPSLIHYECDACKGVASYPFGEDSCGVRQPRP